MMMQLRWQLSGPKVQPPVIWEWDQEHQEHVMDLQPVVEKDQPDYRSRVKIGEW